MAIATTDMINGRPPFLSIFSPYPHRLNATGCGAAKISTSVLIYIFFLLYLFIYDNIK
jgi:hypothetical protein